MKDKDEIKLIVGLLIKNEADKYLKEVLDDIATYADGFVVVDNGSVDNSAEICLSYEKCLKVIIDTADWNTNETHLRKVLFNLACSFSPDWILILDADEILEKNFRQFLPGLMESKEYNWYGFTICHFWGSKTYYRIDKLWAPHNSYIRMCRWLPKFNYLWPNYNIGNPLPMNVHQILNGKKTDIRIKHLAYSNTEDIKKRYDRYSTRPGDFHQKTHVESILDKNIILRKWDD